MTDSPPSVIDIEASGFGRRSYPIEIGYVRGDGRSFCTLVRPSPQWTHWDPDAERVHGIARDTLLRHGRDVAEVAARLNADLAGLTVYCDGWGHDYPWLGALFDEAELAPAFRLESVRSLLDEALLAQLPQLQRDALAELGAPRHRASNDARALQLAIGRARGAAALSRA
ncbi:MAG: hypothetical protein U1F56_09395 [Rubrivivax sp.]